MADEANTNDDAEALGLDENENGSFSLQPGAAAVIFQPTGEFGVILPRVEPGQPMPPSALMAMCVQELAEDRELTQTLINRMVEKGKLGMKPQDEPAEG